MGSKNIVKKLTQNVSQIKVGKKTQHIKTKNYLL